MFLFILNSALVLLASNHLFLQPVNSAELHPLEAAGSTCDNFEVIMGIDKHIGRYYTFHYEFK